MAPKALHDDIEKHPTSIETNRPRSFSLDGGHYEVNNFEGLGVRIVEPLGRGRFATVDKAEHVKSGSVVALKIFHVTNEDESVKEVNLRSEVHIMQKVGGHRHIVRVLASYRCNTTEQLGFFLEPVADSDLSKMIRRRRNTHSSPLWKGWPDAELQILKTSFGCLAGAVAFVHGQRIRHKDIKPENILIHKGGIMLSDFGIAFDAALSNEGITTTDGAVGPHTQRYAAPEVVRDGAKRNRKTDMFALGCVYIEIMEALDLIEIDPPTLVKVFRDSAPAITEILNKCRYEERLQCLAGLTAAMISGKAEERPPAEENVKMLTQSGQAEFFCNMCLKENVDKKYA